MKSTYSHRRTCDHKAGKGLLPFCLNTLHILQSVKYNKHTYEKSLSPDVYMNLHFSLCFARHVDFKELHLMLYLLIHHLRMQLKAVTILTLKN